MIYQGNQGCDTSDISIVVCIHGVLYHIDARMLVVARLHIVGVYTCVVRCMASWSKKTCSPSIAFSNTRRYFKLNKGQALLYGPGSIHHAHSRIEKIGVAELKEAVEAYKKIAKICLERPSA